jgi:hypothetical protein
MKRTLRQEDMPGAVVTKRNLGTRRYNWMKIRSKWHIYDHTVKYPVIGYAVPFLTKDVSICNRAFKNCIFWTTRGHGIPDEKDCCPICYKIYSETAKVWPKPEKIDEEPNAWYNQD